MVAVLDGDLMGNQQDPRANHFNDKNCRIFAKKNRNLDTNESVWFRYRGF